MENRVWVMGVFLRCLTQITGLRGEALWGNVPQVGKLKHPRASRSLGQKGLGYPLGGGKVV